jgi:DNA ligase (NAD+)
MAKQSDATKKRVKGLRTLIEYHRKRYHELDSPEISDEAYDSLIRELISLETEFPSLKTKDSPTVRIGGEPIASFEKVRHDSPQWSFDNVFNEEELGEWETRMVRFLQKEDISSNFSYCAEHKIDGLKVVLTYKDGIFVRGATRGDGVIGENVTNNLKTIETIPLKLTKKVNCTVVGEAWLPAHELKRINKERVKNNEMEFANSRNAAAGTLRQLDPKVVANRKLQAFTYDIDLFDPRDTGIVSPKTQVEELELLGKLGFNVNKTYKFCKNLDEVVSYYKTSITKKHSLPYGVDGVAVKVNDRSLCEALGYTAKAPRYAVAFKFPAEQATTKVEDIVLQIGRTGVLTPVAKLSPVLIDGSTVSRATLHNEDEIKRLDVRVGDTVILQKAGDVIPDIVRVLTELRTGKEKPYIFPKKVPECGGDGSIERIPGQVAYRCVFKNSGAQQRRKLEYFVSKKAFNIDGLGKKIIEFLMEENLLSSFDDIFTLKRGDIEHLEGFGELSAQKLIASIDSARKVTLSRFLTSLSIPQVGEETAEDLANAFCSLESIRKAKVSDLESISGVGPIIAEAVINWFGGEENKKLIERLLKHISVLPQTRKKISGKLSGKTFVLTGTLPTLKRDEVKELIKNHGGSVVGSVSSKTDYLVVGEDPGEKFNEALRLGVKNLNEKDFLALINR